MSNCLSRTLAFVLGAVAVLCLGWLLVDLNPPSRLICKDAGKPQEMARGVILHYDSLYRIWGPHGLVTFEKSDMQECITMPVTDATP